MRIHVHLVAILATNITVQAQNVPPRGTTRLEPGGMRLVHGSTAVYPEAARRNGIEGTVAVEASLDAKGHVADAHVVTGPIELRAAALKSILDDHFATDGSVPRKVQLSVVFSLQKTAVPAAALRDFGNPPPLIVSIECAMLPADLCRDGRQRLTPSIGSALTAEKIVELQKEVADLDDHLVLNPRKTANGMVLALWLHYETSPDVPVGIVGGIAGGIPAGPPPPPPPPKREERPPTVQRIRVGENEQQAKLTRRTEPVYPPLAKQGRIQGVVIFSAIIAKDGGIQQLELVSGHPFLVPAATEAVKQWKYQTTSLNGEPVEVSTRITVNFTLAQ